MCGSNVQHACDEVTASSVHFSSGRDDSAMPVKAKRVGITAVHDYEIKGYKQ